ncbi:signal peptidase I [Bariatricus massiliensis]|uniref:Signal peptidase I n=1 Tax=Bariatricus massiliensis TaxID=1745713 RepID=A0ABS8DE55_9FIRM|nr:signal peptidase I [Bariatricus massiliensis]MCB7303292.1 signal peptidase I [Bariatricus massiliensis]MCB7373424.1 signal peptidase I [Bariatricus massiliensis]MCB7386094.1 signal peptidase I [Bariatricus massiliensis]MCB7410256.1 signal peptidase I [Bariatricus massiliensis]MCQ5252460.1 signal peptidase I [Bariatricus massiliensis]
MHRDLKFGRESRHINLDWVPEALKWALQIVIVCIFAFVFVWYFGQRISNIGDSMNPVLKNGDVVLVNRILYDASSPKRGDIIVFKPNGNENLHSYVKRIVGLPGETVQIKDGAVYIDGKKLKESYKTTSLEEAGLAAEEITLGGNEFFVLGDNRESSEDSRMADIGNVKRSEIEGKAWFNITPGNRFGLIG